MKKYPEDIECIFSPIQGVGGIYISNIDAASNINTLNKHNIKAVITACRGYLLKHSPEELPYYLYLPADDHESFDISKYFQEAIEFIDNKRRKTNVLIHCMAGVSRSVTLVLAYLIKNHGHTTQSAYHTVKKQRRKIDPNTGFIDQLKKFQSSLQQRTRDHSVGNIRKSNVMNSSVISNRGLSSTHSALFNSTVHSSSKPHASVIYSPRKYISGIHPSRIMNNFVSPPKQAATHIPYSKSLARTLSNQNNSYITPSSAVQYKSKLSSNIRQYDLKLKDDIRKLQVQNIKLKQALDQRRRENSARKPMKEIYSGN